MSTPRVPVLTLAVATMTAAVSVWGLLDPAVLLLLRRDGALVDGGEVWRLGTSLLVQDGGWLGTASNIAGLVVLGALAERRFGRARWVVAYLGAGLVGEVVGWLGWQPIGAGNSVAVCGLAGLLAAATRVSGSPEERVAAVAAACWVLLLFAASQVPGAVLIVGWVAVLVLVNVAAFGGLGPVAPAHVVALAGIGVAVTLLVGRDIHGAALAAGLVLGQLLARTGAPIGTVAGAPAR